MTEQILFILSAFVLVILVFIVPHMVNLRVRVLRWIRWNRLADWHQRNFDALVVVVRIIFGALIAILIILAIFS